MQPSPTAAVPTSRALARQLRRLVVIRLVAITSVTVPYFLLRLAAVPDRPLSFDLLFLLAALTYLASFAYLGLLVVLKRRLVLQASIQFAGDLLLITGLVYYFGGIASPFSLLYLLVIAVASVLLRRRAGIWVATGAYVLYSGVLFAIYFGTLPDLLHSLDQDQRIWRLAYNLAVHLFGFYAVALLTSYLADSVSRTEAELAHERDRFADLRVAYRDIIQSIPSGLLTTDPEGRITSVNRSGAEILGAEELSLVGAALGGSDFLSEARWRQLATDSELSPAQRQETELVRGERRIPIGFSISRLADAQGTARGYIVVFQDLSELRRLEEQLNLKDRMAAVGELAAGIAHEVGNPLAAISGSVQMLSAEPGMAAGQRKLLDIVLRESQRLDRTIKGFLRFARARERANVAFDAAHLVAENFALLRNSPEALPTHRLILELPQEPIPMRSDPDQLSQIFWNLARNSLRAMPGGGELTVAARAAAQRLRLSFSDTGQGMSDEQRRRLFQPFQSFFDGGTGLGMAIVYRIVQEHGGLVDVESETNCGSTVTVELPLEPLPLVLPAREVPA